MTLISQWGFDVYACRCHVATALPKGHQLGHGEALTDCPAASSLGT